MWPFFKGTHLDVDAHTPAVFIGFGGQRQDLRLLGHCATQVIFREEKFHERDYTLSYRQPSCPVRRAWRLEQGSFIKQKCSLRIVAYTFVLDALTQPVLEVGFLVFNGPAAREFVQRVVQMQRAW